VGNVTAYLVELYISRSEGDGVERRVELARGVADELTRAGLPVAWV